MSTPAVDVIARIRDRQNPALYHDLHWEGTFGEYLRLVQENPAVATQILDRLVPRLNGAVADVRSLVHELRPPTLDELGLAGAVRELAARFAGPGRHVEAQLGDVEGLPAAVDLAAYRIVSEALSNAVRHGSATEIQVRVLRDRDRLHVEVSDNGTGIDPLAVPGVGLASMRARAEELGGSFSVGPGAEASGTTITALLPLSVEEENE